MFEHTGNLIPILNALMYAELMESTGLLQRNNSKSKITVKSAIATNNRRVQRNYANEITVIGRIF